MNCINFYAARPMKLKEDILSCTAAELSFGLCQFIQEVRRPNGKKYEPDSIFYLCLGIQQVLHDANDTQLTNIYLAVISLVYSDIVLRYYNFLLMSVHCFVLEVDPYCVLQYYDSSGKKQWKNCN